MPEFVTCLNCMDGRVQKPMIQWLEKNHGAWHVDMITEAGMDGYLVSNEDVPESLKYKIDISVNKHGSKDIFVIGHHDCGGHPVDEVTHRQHIIKSVGKIKKLYPGCSVSGIWISAGWGPEKITLE
jgi:carbonic anhydrase